MNRTIKASIDAAIMLVMPLLIVALFTALLGLAISLFFNVQFTDVTSSPVMALIDVVMYVVLILNLTLNNY